MFAARQGDEVQHALNGDYELSHQHLAAWTMRLLLASPMAHQAPVLCGLVLTASMQAFQPCVDLVSTNPMSIHIFNHMLTRMFDQDLDLRVLIIHGNESKNRAPRYQNLKITGRQA